MGQRSSQILSNRRDEGESQSLLTPAEQLGRHQWFPADDLDEVCPNPFKSLPVYTNIYRIRKDIIAAIDDPYDVEQLRSPRMNISVVRPLVDKFYELNDVSIVYCLLVNKAQFLKEQSSQPHQQSVCMTRAMLCELVAVRILRRFNEDNNGTQGLLLLAQILVGGFDPFQGAPKQVIRENSNLAWVVEPRTGYKRRLPALEVAIISDSKIFLSSSACQKVVNAIYEGRVVYTPTSFIDILPDHYKNKPIALYDPHKAPVFNQYRLIVPRTRNILEVCHFVVLLALYLFVLADRDASKFGGMEFIFVVYSLGWVLDLSASIFQHGWQVYTQNLWSFLDVTFSAIFAIYLVLRIHGFRTGQLDPAQQALDVLAMGAPVLIPRLAFNLMSENMLFVSLRAMMRDFTILTGLAVWCFAGFLLSMFWLSDGTHGLIIISKWMLWIWFGLDGTGIPESVGFHWILGPILMVTFTFLGNTLFLTILVSMLTTTFSNIVSNATAEIQFRRAVLTLEGVKSDAIFAYQPPVNLLAILILLPLNLVLSPRWFHKINVAAVRVINAPLLLIIGMIEQRMLWSGEQRHEEVEQLPPKPPSRAGLWDFSRGFSVHGDIRTVFEREPPQSVEDEISREDSLDTHAMEESLTQAISPGTSRKDTKDSIRRSRRDSMAPLGGLQNHLRDLLKEDDVEGESTKSRLDNMEKSIFRIEEMLKGLVEDLDTSGRGQPGNTGRMENLDKSGTADLTDD